MKTLLNNKAGINLCTTNIGASPLHAACENGYVNVVQLLLEYNLNIINYTTNYGATALFFVCYKGHTNTVKTLIEEKADINKSRTDNDVHVSPLFAACLMLDNGAETNRYRTKS